MRLFQYTITVKGFSMLEVLLSVFVLSVGLMTIVAVMSGSLRHSYETRDTIIATGLAQEGIELVRNVRDNNFFASDGFDGPSFDTSNEHCRIDWDDTDVTCYGVRGAMDRYYLQYDNGTGRYARTSATRERYMRFIYIYYRTGGGVKRALVRSFVSWGSFTPTVANIPNNGNPTNCSASPTCVYTETFLTAWQ